MLRRTALTGLAVAVALAPVAAMPAAAQEVVTLEARVIGPGPQGIKKATNLEWAADVLNRMLADAGEPRRVDLDVEFSELGWGPFAEKFYLDFRAGNAPDIVTMRETADLAAGGFVVAFDDHLAAYGDSFYADFYENLWDGARYDGHIWGIPHDVAPAGIWYRKDVLRQLGYSDADIDRMLPSDGDTTMETLVRLATEATEAGLVEFGLLHRPSSGSNFYNRMLAAGIRAVDSETGGLVLDVPGLTEFLAWHRDLVEAGVLPAEPPPWATIHASFVEGATFATLASHVGTPSEWMATNGLTEQQLAEDLGFLPFPPTEAARAEGVGPVSLSDLPLYLVTSQSEHPDLARLIVMLAVTPYAAAVHADYSARPPVRRAALVEPPLADNAYVQRVAPAAAAVHAAPVQTAFWDYMGRIFEAVKGVEAGVVSPEEAVADLQAWFQAQVEDGIVIGG